MLETAGQPIVCGGSIGTDTRARALDAEPAALLLVSAEQGCLHEAADVVASERQGDDGPLREVGEGGQSVGSPYISRDAMTYDERGQSTLLGCFTRSLPIVFGVERQSTWRSSKGALVAGRAPYWPVDAGVGEESVRSDEDV